MARDSKSRRGPWRRRADLALWDQQRHSGPGRAWPTTRLWRVRYELLLVLEAAAVVVVLNRQFGAALTTSIVCVAVGAGFSVPPLREAIILLWWHVVTPHQIRRSCVEAGIYNRKGRLPLILRTRTRRFDQIVTVYCVPGTSPEDFAECLPLFRTACWAEAIQLQRHPRGEPFLHIRVVRRSAPDDHNSWGQDSHRSESGADSDYGTDHRHLGDDDWAARTGIPRPRASTNLRTSS
jgi:hypothetical protein